MRDPPAPPEDVRAYYAEGGEPTRLDDEIGVLERERTQELLARFLPPRCRIADVGGADGRYAGWLAARGHRVELVEPVPLHLELARARAGDPPLFAVGEGDARSLPLGDGCVDAVLLLGPLYHLGDREERVRALREAARVCRPGGLLLAAAISRLTPLVDALRRGRVDEAVLANVEDEARSGRRVASGRRTSPFPDAWFHRPDELAAEAAEAGWRVEGVSGVEGPGSLLPHGQAGWNDEQVRSRLVRLARAFEQDPQVAALSAHLLLAARRP